MVKIIAFNVNSYYIEIYRLKTSEFRQLRGHGYVPFGSVASSCLANARGEPRPIAGATQERRLLGVGFRVEPVVTQPAPPQTRTCAMNAYGSSVTSVSAPLWRIPVLPCMAHQMWWTILGVGKAYVCSSFWNFSHRIGLLLLRRLNQYCHAFSA